MTLSSVFLLSCIFAFFNGYEAAAATGTTQKYSAPILLTYPGMTNAGVTGTIIYDVSQKTVAFNYPGLSYTEIYRWNSNLGYASSDRYSDQYVWKIAPYASCTLVLNMEMFMDSLLLTTLSGPSLVFLIYQTMEQILLGLLIPPPIAEDILHLPVPTALLLIFI